MAFNRRSHNAAPLPQGPAQFRTLVKPGQEPLAAVDAGMTNWEFTHCNLENDSLTVRTVDKYGNESPDSNPILVPPAQDCDGEEPVPEAPDGGTTDVGAVPVPTPVEEWAIYEASTDFSAMGLFVDNVATVAERKACRLRGGGLCTDTSPTLSEINLGMALAPSPHGKRPARLSATT